MTHRNLAGRAGVALLLFGLAGGHAVARTPPAHHSSGIITRTIDPGQRITFSGNNFRFMGGERAEILVRGDGDADLDLYVYDAEGNLVCRQVSRSSSELCVFHPRWTETFQIVVRNEGTERSAFVLTTN